MAVQFQMNHVGIEELLSDPILLAELRSMGEAVAAKARETAPYSDRDTGEEHYRDSIETGQFFDSTSLRETVYVRASVPWATDVEVIHRTLGKALGESGGTA